MTPTQICALLVFSLLALFWARACFHNDEIDRKTSVVFFLWVLGAFILHDAYGNRLLPKPNWLAQIIGYASGLMCLILGARMVWR